MTVTVYIKSATTNRICARLSRKDFMFKWDLGTHFSMFKKKTAFYIFYFHSFVMKDIKQFNNSVFPKQ
jgi:hypothetical protein